MSNDKGSTGKQWESPELPRERLDELLEIERRYGQLLHAMSASPGRESGFRSILQAIFGDLPVGVCLLDAGLQYVWLNEALAGLNGIPVADHIGRTVAEVLPKYAATVEQPARRVLTTGQPIWQWPMVGSGRNTGSGAHYEAGYLPLMNPFRSETMVLVLVHKVQFEHSAPHQLSEARMDYDTLLENFNDAVFILDPASELILQANSRACTTYGLNQSQMLGLSFKDFTRDVPRGEQKIRELMLAGLLSDFETTHLRRDGSAIDVRVNASVIRHKGRKALLVVVHNISDLRQAQRDLSESLLKVRTVMEGTVQAMAMTVEMRDPYTAGHQRRVASLSVAIGRALGLDPDLTDGLRWAGMVHDIGKIAVPAELLSKPGRLSPIEFTLIKTHSEQGSEIVRSIQFPWPVAAMVLQHHERCDGSGYPGGLPGEQIEIGARIIAVADVVEAMASHRPYRPALGLEAALHEIGTNSGRLYDPDVTAAALDLFRNRDFQFE